MTTYAEIQYNHNELVQHSKVRGQLLAEIEQALYGAFNKERQKEYQRIIAKNSYLHNNDQQCMRVGSAIWGQHLYFTYKVPLPKKINMPHPEIEKELKEFIEAENSTEAEERLLVLNSLRTILTQTSSFKDYEEIFPQKLHAILRKASMNAPPQDREEHFLSPEQREHLKQSQRKYLHLMAIAMTRNLLNL